jgi:glycerophosphoryl diester phosphodiesterase
MRRLLPVLLVGLLAPLFVPSASPAAEAPVIYAHRGGAAEAPENTLGAFRQTIDRYGTDVWLEMDTQLTADGQLVVIHDDSLDRTTSCAGAIIDWSYDAACDAGDPEGGFPDWGFEPVPLLTDVAAEGKAAGWKLQIELKDIPGEANFDPSGAAAATALAEVLAAVGYPAADIEVQSFWPPALDAFRESAQARGLDDIELVLLTTSTLPGAPEGVGFLVAENVAFAAARGYEISAPDHRSLDAGPEAVAAAHAAGRRLVHWTVDDPARIVAIAAWGADGIITNAPGEALSALGR